MLDPTVHAYRSDIADIALAGQLFAPHYARPAMVKVSGGTLRSKPGLDGDIIAELAKGEDFALLDTTGGWAWGYRRSDHRVGYLRASSIV